MQADTLRIATYAADLSRRGPGLLLADITKGDVPQVEAAIQVIAKLDADVLLISDFDYDSKGVALEAFAKRLADAGQSYAVRFALRPNTGLPTGLDIDRNGYLNDARDAQGFGRFAGEGGMAILSRLPINRAQVQDYSTFLWKDLPGALLPDGMTDAEKDLQRLSTTAHWQVPLSLPDGAELALLAWSATPPVFDGPEDRNGKRNHDESVFWTQLIDGKLPMPAPRTPFVLLGNANLDPMDGDGLTDGISALLSHPALQDVAPKGSHNRQENHRGDPLRDTADFSGAKLPGGLRVDYVLPSTTLRVAAAGVMWPPDSDPFSKTLATASRHRPVWVDITLPVDRPMQTPVALDQIPPKG